MEIYLNNVYRLSCIELLEIARMGLKKVPMWQKNLLLLRGSLLCCGLLGSLLCCGLLGSLGLSLDNGSGSKSLPEGKLQGSSSLGSINLVVGHDILEDGLAG